MRPLPPVDPHPGLAANADRHREALWRYLRVLGADAVAADDLVQEVFLVALQRADFDDRVPGAVFTFLRRTARYLWLRSLRRRTTPLEVEAADLVWQQHCGDGPGDDYVDALRQCVERLPARSRTLLQATYGDGDGRTAAGARIGLGEQGVKSSLRRLRAFLHDCIRQRLEAL